MDDALRNTRGDWFICGVMVGLLMGVAGCVLALVS